MLSPRQTLTVVKDAGRDFFSDQALNHAAAVSFYTVFSLAPVLLLTVLIAGVIAGEDQVREQLLGQFGSLMGDQGRTLIETVITNAKGEPRHGVLATIIGIGAAVVGASGAFGQLKVALNTVWEVTPEPRKRSWYQTIWRFLRGRILSFAMVLVIAFILLASLVVSAGLAGVGAWMGDRWSIPTEAMQAINFLVGVVIIAALFTTIFKVLPDAKVGWREALLGGIVTSLLFSLGKFAFGLYLGRSSIASVYGAAGSVVLLLLWVYYSAAVLLLGAEITQRAARALGKPLVPRQGYVLTNEAEAPSAPSAPSAHPSKGESRKEPPPRGRPAAQA